MSKEQNKNYGKSIRTKLLNVARKENVFNQTILTRYFQERLLYRISQTHYRGNFYLKGGALMYAYEKFAARPTLDIDFLGNNITNISRNLHFFNMLTNDMESTNKVELIFIFTISFGNINSICNTTTEVVK